MPEPTQLVPFDAEEQQLNPFTSSLRLSPAILWQKLISLHVFAICPFCHYTELRIIGEGGKED